MAQYDLIGQHVSDPDDAAQQDCEPARLGRRRDHSRDPEILNAALDVLAETGYEGMTMDMVAARARAGKATVYRRWPSKAELVVDAVACMKSPVDMQDVPDTGSLRGDLISAIRPHSIVDAERKMRVMGGLIPTLTRDPELAEAVHRAIVEPRAALNRALLRRAILRGEIPADVDVETVAHISPSMAVYRSMVLRQPVDREFLIGLIDGVVLPALGLAAGQPATSAATA